MLQHYELEEDSGELISEIIESKEYNEKYIHVKNLNSFI